MDYATLLSQRLKIAQFIIAASALGVMFTFDEINWGGVEWECINFITVCSSLGITLFSFAAGSHLKSRLWKTFDAQLHTFAGSGLLASWGFFIYHVTNVNDSGRHENYIRGAIAALVLEGVLILMYLTMPYFINHPIRDASNSGKDPPTGLRQAQETLNAVLPTPQSPSEDNFEKLPNEANLEEMAIMHAQGDPSPLYYNYVYTDQGRLTLPDGRVHKKPAQHP